MDLGLNVNPLYVVPMFFYLTYLYSLLNFTKFFLNGFQGGECFQRTFLIVIQFFGIGRSVNGYP